MNWTSMKNVFSGMRISPKVDAELRFHVQRNVKLKFNNGTHQEKKNYSAWRSPKLKTRSLLPGLADCLLPLEPPWALLPSWRAHNEHRKPSAVVSHQPWPPPTCQAPPSWLEAMAHHHPWGALVAAPPPPLLGGRCSPCRDRYRDLDYIFFRHHLASLRPPCLVTAAAYLGQKKHFCLFEMRTGKGYELSQLTLPFYFITRQTSLDFSITATRSRFPRRHRNSMGNIAKQFSEKTFCTKLFELRPCVTSFRIQANHCCNNCLSINVHYYCTCTE